MSWSVKCSLILCLVILDTNVSGLSFKTGDIAEQAHSNVDNTLSRALGRRHKSKTVRTLKQVIYNNDHTSEENQQRYSPSRAAKLQQSIINLNPCPGEGLKKLGVPVPKDCNYDDVNDGGSYDEYNDYYVNYDDCDKDDDCVKKNKNDKNDSDKNKNCDNNDDRAKDSDCDYNDDCGENDDCDNNNENENDDNDNKNDKNDSYSRVPLPYKRGGTSAYNISPRQEKKHSSRLERHKYETSTFRTDVTHQSTGTQQIHNSIDQQRHQSKHHQRHQSVQHRIPLQSPIKKSESYIILSGACPDGQVRSLGICVDDNYDDNYD